MLMHKPTCVFVSENGMDTDQLFTCNVCQKTFLQIDDLRKHNKNHLFSCADCNQAFNDQITLTKHQEEVLLSSKWSKTFT